uniref:GDSL esterase/lipase n=1 Tax=Aegilops tauschii subsp. strangulata TaxID=200361 RepID=A0A453T3T7_AEGTS
MVRRVRPLCPLMERPTSTAPWAVPPMGVSSSTSTRKRWACRCCRLALPRRRRGSSRPVPTLPCLALLRSTPSTSCQGITSICRAGASTISSLLSRECSHGLLREMVPATKSLLSESLVVFGEIGGNDYNFWFFDRTRSRDTAQEYIPDVVARIGAGVQEVIKLGAKTILVPGNFPIGCVPVYLRDYKSNTSTDYDQFGCLKWFNTFSQMHNQLLKQKISMLKSQNPGVKIIYGDYYGAFMEFVKNPLRNGIDKPLVACCGGDGPYGTGHECNQKAKVCPDPSRFANWDQIHMTEKAYNVIANGVLNGPYADTPLLHTC